MPKRNLVFHHEWRHIHIGIAPAPDGAVLMGCTDRGPSGPDIDKRARLKDWAKLIAPQKSNLAVSVERIRRVQFSSSLSSAVAISFDFASFCEHTVGTAT